MAVLESVPDCTRNRMTDRKKPAVLLYASMMLVSVLAGYPLSFRPALGVAFAAFCVWLAVRWVNRQWKPTRRFWACVVPAGMLYVASSGPMRVVSYWERFGTIDRFEGWWWDYYWPIAWVARQP